MAPLISIDGTLQIRSHRPAAFIPDDVLAPVTRREAVASVLITRWLRVPVGHRVLQLSRAKVGGREARGVFHGVVGEAVFRTARTRFDAHCAGRSPTSSLEEFRTTPAGRCRRKENEEVPAARR